MFERRIEAYETLRKAYNQWAIFSAVITVEKSWLCVEKYAKRNEIFVPNFL